jgi:glyoxylase-like metal-dependent hydrolase (beta-lactamase superfamily II)
MIDFPIENYAHGITCIDTGLGRPGLAACYLMEQKGRLAIIETGIAKTVPRILALIADRGFTREDVEYVIITHVHLDHAGGVGGLLQALPNAQLVVHPKGAQHMVDPSKLQAGAMAVYGEERYRATYGELIPVAEQRVVIADDEFVLNFNGRPLRFIDTPGHARHHFCVYDEQSRGIFTGDTLGIVYRALCHDKFNFVMPSTTPVQFEPELLKSSVERLMALNPQYFYLTHFGRVEATANHAQQMYQSIDSYVSMARKLSQSENRHQDITDSLIANTLAELETYGSPIRLEKQRQLIEMDMSVNAQGLEVWLDKQQLKATKEKQQ